MLVSTINYSSAKLYLATTQVIYLSLSHFFPFINLGNLTFEPMSDHQYKFHVQMGCGGCSRAIKKAVEALTGES
jgi:hypothetical protein